MDIEEIVKAHPLSCEFETDARDVWPQRWAALESALAAEKEKTNMMGGIIFEQKCQLADAREKVRKLREALLAARVMWDRGPSPRKLDEALSWRENDEGVSKMVAEVLADTAPAETDEVEPGK